MKQFLIQENEKEKLRLLGIDWEVSMTIIGHSFNFTSWLIIVSDEDFNLIKLSYPKILEGLTIISNEIDYEKEL